MMLTGHKQTYHLTGYDHNNCVHDLGIFDTEIAAYRVGERIKAKNRVLYYTIHVSLLVDGSYCCGIGPV
jgi:hypothetical protein